jgi:hypothetical protein
MITYHFTYTNASGGLIRLTAMQCGSDSHALVRAHETMKDEYAGLFVVAGERAVYSFMPF